MNRWLKYALVGLAFGVLDWYYLDLLAHFSWGSFGESILVVPVIILLNYGIWLVPLIPVVWLEARQSQRRLYPILAGMLTWSCAIFSYYAYYTALLSTGALPHLEHLSLFAGLYPGFWEEWTAMFRRIILDQFLEWIVVALVGGAVVAALESWLYRRWSLRRANA